MPRNTVTRTAAPARRQGETLIGRAQGSNQTQQATSSGGGWAATQRDQTGQIHSQQAEPMGPLSVGDPVITEIQEAPVPESEAGPSEPVQAPEGLERQNSISSKNFKEIKGLYDDSIVRKDSPGEILANSKTIADLQASLKKSKTIKNIDSGSLKDAITLDKFVIGMIKEIDDLSFSDLLELRKELIHEPSVETLNPKVQGDNRTIAGRMGSYSTLKELQEIFKIKRNKPDYNPSSKLQKDHVETQECRAILLASVLSALDHGESVLLDGFLNNMRTGSSKVCTRQGTYLETGSFYNSRSSIMAVTLLNDEFKYSVAHRYSLKSAQNIMKRLYVQHKYEIMRVQQDVNWKCVPTHLSLPLYELSIAVFRFSRNFAKNSLVVSPISNQDILILLSERQGALDNLISLTGLFENYLKNNNALNSDQQRAIKNILNPFITNVDTSIRTLFNDINAETLLQNAPLNKELHPSIIPLQEFREKWATFSNKLEQTFSLDSSLCAYNQGQSNSSLNQLDIQSRNLGLHKDAYPFQQEELAGIGKGSSQSQQKMTEQRRLSALRRFFYWLFISSF